MYTSKERVCRDGYLIAFEGEVMTEEEAAIRGLSADSPKPKKRAPKKAKQDAAEEAEGTPEDARQDDGGQDAAEEEY